MGNLCCPREEEDYAAVPLLSDQDQGYEEHPQVVPFVDSDDRAHLPYRDLFDETRTDTWEQYRKPYVGKIIFSNSKVSKQIDPATLLEEFQAGDEIHGRAVWGRALRNFPLGTSQQDGSYVYGPEVMLSKRGRANIHSLQFILKVSIDGKDILRDFGDSDGADVEGFGYSMEHGPDGSHQYKSMGTMYADYKVNSDQTDFYSFNQSISMRLIGKQNRDDPWYAGIPSFLKALSRCAPGRHTVSVSIHFRIFPHPDEIERWRRQEMLRDAFGRNTTWPFRDPTPMSHAIAQGQFEVVVTEESKLMCDELASPLPKRATMLDTTTADRWEAAILRHLLRVRTGKSAPLNGSLFSQWHWMGSGRKRRTRMFCR